MRIVIHWPAESELPTRVVLSGHKPPLDDPADPRVIKALDMYRSGAPMCDITRAVDRTYASVKRMLSQFLPDSERRVPRKHVRKLKQYEPRKSRAGEFKEPYEPRRPKLSRDAKARAAKRAAYKATIAARLAALQDG